MTNIKKFKKFILENRNLFSNNNNDVKGNDKEIFNKNELLDLIKSYDFKTVNVSDMETVTYSSSDNPFDKWDVGTITLSPLVRDYYDSLLISIDKYKGRYIVRIGTDTGWVGGLSKDDTELSFDIPNLTFEEFKKGFINSKSNQIYCLLSKDKILFKGTIEEIKKYGLSEGYEIMYTDPDEEGKIVDFYLYNKNLESWDPRNNLNIYVLSSMQIDNINNN